MRKFFLAGLIFVFILNFSTLSKAAEFKGFDVYTDKWAKGNHYIPSGWMGDYSDVKFTDGCTDNPHSPKTCIKIAYSATGSQGAGWGGMYWQNPANNWGEKQGGFDLTGAKRLVFWARGEKGGEVCEFKMGGITGTYSDSDAASTEPITLTKEWKEYSIDLSGLDLSYINGGFCWVANKENNPNGLVIYIDDIKYE